MKITELRKGGERLFICLSLGLKGDVSSLKKCEKWVDYFGI
jgi:hypothetical protein